MGVPSEDGYRVVDVETRPKVVAASGLTLVPVPRQQLQDATFDGESLFYAAPSNDHMAETWGMFKYLAESDVALLAKGALRSGVGTEKIWRLDSFNGYLVLREVVFPEYIKPIPEAQGRDPDADTVELVNKFVNTLLTDWSDFDSKDTMAARVKAWVQDGTDVSVEVPAAAPVLDLKAQLEAMLNG